MRRNLTTRQRRDLYVAFAFGSGIQNYGDVTFEGLEIEFALDGLLPSDAYFAVTSQGKRSVKTTNVPALKRLLTGRRSANRFINQAAIEMGRGRTLIEIVEPYVRKDKAVARWIVRCLGARKTYRKARRGAERNRIHKQVSLPS